VIRPVRSYVKFCDVNGSDFSDEFISCWEEISHITDVGKNLFTYHIRWRSIRVCWSINLELASFLSPGQFTLFVFFPVSFKNIHFLILLAHIARWKFWVLPCSINRLLTLTLTVVIARSGNSFRAQVSSTSRKCKTCQSTQNYTWRGCWRESSYISCRWRPRRGIEEASLDACRSNRRQGWQGEVPGWVRRSVVQRATVDIRRAGRWQWHHASEKILTGRPRQITTSGCIHTVATAMQ